MSDTNGTRPSADAYQQAGTAIMRQGFGSSEMETRRETQGIAAAETAKALVQARYLVAMQRPRDILEFRARMLKHCQRERFAEAAEYAKPVGGSKIKGASIRFVEASLTEYGNVDVKTTPIYEDDVKRIVTITVTDLERNMTHAADVTVEKYVERRSTKSGDEVIGERRNSQGATVYRIRATEDDYTNKLEAACSKRLRQLGLRILPPDVVAECMDECRATRENKDAKDPDAAKKAIADAFSSIGVMPSALKEYLGHDLDSTSPAEIDDLRSVYVAIRDGESTWVAAMETKSGAAADAKPADKTADALKEKLAKAPAGDKSGSSSKTEAPKSPPPAVKWRPPKDGAGLTATSGDWTLHVEQSGPDEFAWSATDKEGEIRQGVATSLDGAQKFAEQAAK